MDKGVILGRNCVIQYNSFYFCKVNNSGYFVEGMRGDLLVLEVTVRLSYELYHSITMMVYFYTKSQRIKVCGGLLD